MLRTCRIIEFINRAFASTKVEAKYEEIEAILDGRRTAQQIAADIGSSNAVFILLGENVEKLRHTQQWVLWESGVAGAANKDIWVFEAHEDHGKLSVLIPHLHHHACFEYSDPWLAYIRAVVSSYDDSHVLPAISAGVATGIASENPVAGIVVGGIVALLLAGNKQAPPAGLMAILCTQLYVGLSNSSRSGLEFDALSCLQRSTSTPVSAELVAIITESAYQMSRIAASASLGRATKLIQRASCGGAGGRWKSYEAT